MNQIPIKITHVIIAFILIIIGVVGAVTPSSFNWLSTTVFGSASLLIIFGYRQFKSMMRPMNRPYFWKLAMLFVLSFLIKGGLVAVGEIFHLVDVNEFPTNPAVGAANNGGILSNVIEVIKTSVSIVGEELLVAGITLPLYFYVKKNKFGWVLSNLIGCLAFGIMHIVTYDFQLWPCLMVGLSRYPYSQAWKSTNSLRGGMYIHLISDLIILVPAMFV